MARLALLRLRQWWERAFWLIPLIGLVAAFVLEAASQSLDEALFAGGLGNVISPAAAITLLAAVGGGMITFTGFVFSVVLLMLQYGSSEYSPRTVSYFLRSRTLQWVLAIYIATILFAFLSILEVGSNDRVDFVPVGSMVVAVLMLVVSLFGFLALLNVVSNRIRVDAVLTAFGRTARRTLTDRSAVARGPRVQALPRIPAPPTDARLIKYSGRPGQVVAVDTHGLARLARRHGSHVIMMIRLGDAVSLGSHVAMVTGSGPTDDQLSRRVLTSDERSLRHDPLYALRILTDISLRALSPGINDPTTAVRSLDEVEGVLRTAALLQLGPAKIDAGGGSIVLRAPTWSDIVDLAFTEVLDVGVGQVQITRRLTALLNDLLADLPPSHHPPLLRHKRWLVDRIDVAWSGEFRSIALTGDRQGIGGSR